MSSGSRLAVTVWIVSLVVTIQVPCARACPLDFSVLNGYSSALNAACDGGDKNLTTCCTAAGSGVELSLARYLQETGLFLLSNVTQARLCLRRLRAQMDMIGVQGDVVTDCKFENATNRASVLLWMPELCQGIQSIQDFQARIAGLPMERSCRGNLADAAECKNCVTDMRQVVENLIAVNETLSAECVNFVRIYVVANASDDPWDRAATASCIYALTHDIDEGKSSSKQLYIALGIVATALMSVGVGLFVWAWWHRYERAMHREFMLRNNRMLLYHTSLVWYDWPSLKAATGGFSQAALLGEGGYGSVYKGVLKDGRTIAVKQFKNCTPEGDLEFLNEVEALSKFRHRNLVNLLGCCIACSKHYGHQRILVYDYMPNRSLADYLFNEQNPTLTWEQRRNIAIGIAQGLAYLHVDAQPQIIHRDIKASNVLLDGDLNAHIADFGLAKFASSHSFPPTSHIKGTLGYVAPEYALYGQLTEKSDVYSFGVCLLELLSGRAALTETWDSQSRLDSSSIEAQPSNPSLTSNYLITDWAWSLVVNKRPVEVIDARIRTSCINHTTKAAMTRFVMVAMLCAHVMMSMRPSIDEALRMLEGHCAVPVDRVFERPALPLSHEAGDYVISLGRYNALEIDLTAR